MICVSIGRGRHKHMMAEQKHLVEQGAELVELRLDYINRNLNVKRLLENRKCATIATCRREADGGKWTGDEADRITVLRAAIAEGVEYVDLEEDVAGSIPRFGKTKRIVSMHDFTGTPDDLSDVHARLAALDADVVKIATMAHSPHDNLRVLELIDSADIPTVALCMGEIGTPSRILSPKYGAPFTYATFHHERALAPGQLSFRQMVDEYYQDRIDADTRVFGMIADPIGRTLGPLVHNVAMREAGMNKVYIPFRIPREHLGPFIADCRRLDIHGISVMAPHKEAAIRHCTKIDGAVRGVGAVNTMLFSGGDVLGYNSDYRAAMESIDAALRISGSKALDGKTALVLGAGGMSRAVLFGLSRRSAQVVVASRSADDAVQLANRYGCENVAWDARHKVKANIIINATPVGMHPNVDESPFEPARLRPGTLVVDCVYNPERTLLIKEARTSGCMAVTGMEIFLRTAALQFKHFTGQDAPVELMHNVVKRAIGAAKF